MASVETIIPTSPTVDDYTRLLEKARRERIRILRAGRTPISQHPCWDVASSKKRNTYTVTLTADGFSCDCPAGRNDVYCKHRAAVRCHVITYARAMAVEALALAEGWTGNEWAEQQARRQNPQPQTVPPGYVLYEGGPTTLRPTWIAGRQYVPTH